MTVLKQAWVYLWIFTIGIAITACNHSSNSTNNPSPLEAGHSRISGKIKLDTNDTLESIDISIYDSASNTLGTVNTNTGEYSIDIKAQTESDLIRVHVKYQLEGFPVVTGTLILQGATDGKKLTHTPIVLPDVRTTSLDVDDNGNLVSENGDIKITISDNNNLNAVFARRFNPDIQSDSFPGDFADNETDPLNSSAFIWLGAIDNQGNNATDFSSNPLSVNMAIEPSQWKDLFDIDTSTDAIDIPMYSFDESSGQWVREKQAKGTLVDTSGSALDKSILASINAGTYQGSVHVKFEAAHFSWWNVDYAFHKDLLAGLEDTGEILLDENNQPVLDRNNNPIKVAYDFGDAPNYPEIKHRHRSGQGGASMFIASNRGLISLENTQRTSDTFDDGIIEYQDTTLKIGVANASNNYQAQTAYINVLIDKNKDGQWSDDANEHPVVNHAVILNRRRGTDIEFTNIEWEQDEWMRLTLTPAPISYTAGAIGGGSFVDGETEDYFGRPVRLSTRLTGQSHTSRKVSGSGIDCRGYTRGTCLIDNISAPGASPVILTASADDLLGGITWSYANSEESPCVESNPSTTCSINPPFNRHLDIEAKFPSSFRLKTGITPNSHGVVRSNDGTIECDSKKRTFEEIRKCYRYYRFGTATGEVTLTASPHDDFVFSGWSGMYPKNICAKDQPTCTFEISDLYNAYLIADFNALVETKTSISGAGGITGVGINCQRESLSSNLSGDCSEKIEEGTSITLTANPKEGYYLQSWRNCDQVQGNTCTTTIRTRQPIIIANFNAYPKLSVSVNGFPSSTTGSVTSNVGGIDCGSNCEAIFTSAQTVILTGTADNPSTSMNWSGCDSISGNECTVNMASNNRSIQFNLFAPAPIIPTTPKYQLTVINPLTAGTIASRASAIMCGTGNTQCTQSVNSGTTIQLTASPSAGKVITGWQGCTSISMDNTQCSVTLTSNKTVSANFQDQPSQVNNHELTLVQPDDAGTLIILGNTNYPACDENRPECFIVPDNTAIEIGFVPANESYTLSTWTHACANTASNQNCSFTMTENKTVGVTTQQAQTYTLTINKPTDLEFFVNPAGLNQNCISTTIGITSCADDYVKDTQVTISALPTFLNQALAKMAIIGVAPLSINWSGCDSVNGNSCSVTMDSANTVTLSYAPQSED